MSKMHTKTETTELESAFADPGVERYKELTGTDLSGNKRGLDTLATPYNQAVAQGNLPGQTFESKFGTNEDLDPANAEDVWSVGGLWVPPSAAALPSVVSTDANDTALGTGARLIRLKGLDENFNPITEDVPTNGMTPVPATNLFSRIEESDVIDAGSSLVNIGRIETSIGATVQSAIRVGERGSFSATTTVPAGKVGSLSQLYANIGRKPSADGFKEGNLVLSARLFGQVVFVPLFNISLNSTSGPTSINLEFPEQFPEKTDFKITATVSTNNTRADAALIYGIRDA